jgi:hypothetical protein
MRECSRLYFLRRTHISLSSSSPPLSLDNARGSSSLSSLLAWPACFYISPFCLSLQKVCFLEPASTLSPPPFLRSTPFPPRAPTRPPLQWGKCQRAGGAARQRVFCVCFPTKQSATTPRPFCCPFFSPPTPPNVTHTHTHTHTHTPPPPPSSCPSSPGVCPLAAPCSAEAGGVCVFDVPGCTSAEKGSACGTACPTFFVIPFALNQPPPRLRAHSLQPLPPAAPRACQPGGAFAILPPGTCLYAHTHTHLHSEAGGPFFRGASTCAAAGGGGPEKALPPAAVCAFSPA